MTAHNITAADLEKLLAEVTPGEWEASPGHEQRNGQLYWQIQNEYDAIMQNQFCWAQGSHEANASLIAMAPTLARKVIAAEKLAEAAQWARNRLDIIADESWRGDGRDLKRSIIGVFADFDEAIAAWEAAQ